MAHHDDPAHYGIRTKDRKSIFFRGPALGAAGTLKAPERPGRDGRYA